MSSQKTDKLTTRIIGISTRLSRGEVVTVKELAEEFDVTPRSIQKDLNERLMQFLPIVRVNDQYYMESHFIGKLDYDDIRDFALLSGIKELYPSLNDGALADILNAKINDALLVKGGAYEEISGKKKEFDLIRLAIVLKHQLYFIYKDKKRIVNPYKLVNNNDIWYLVGDENGELKTYSFTKMEKLCRREKSFTPKNEFKEIINNPNNKWFSKNKTKVILEIDSSASEYFLRRELLPHQVILKHTKKKLVVQTTVAYDEEILRVVRYWIPHITIVEPMELDEKLREGLSSYLHT